MRFIVSSTTLSTHLQGISRVINSKNALPILDCFLFELRDGLLTVTLQAECTEEIGRFVPRENLTQEIEADS